MPKTQTHQIIINAELRNLQYVRNFVSSVVNELSFSELEVIKITIAIDEACTNIIKYSYKNNPLKKFKIFAKVIAEELVFEIYDDGPAFDPVFYLSSHQYNFPGQISKSGRGLYIISKFMDSMEYIPKSEKTPYNKLVLKKFLTNTNFL